MSNHFVLEDELKQIDLGDGDWVKIPARFSYGFIEQFGDIDGSDTQRVVLFISKAIKEWNLEYNGEVAPINDEFIRKLDVATMKLIVSEVTSMIQIPKVESSQSVEQ